MKQNLLQLIDKVDKIATLFHKVNGVGFPSVNEISDVEEFIVWKKEIQFELEEIFRTRDDRFIGDTLKTIKDGFNGWNDEQSFRALKGALLTIKGHADTYFPSKEVRTITVEESITMPPKKNGKIFISHSSKDVKYVTKIVDLLVHMGVPNEKIFCSSVPGYDIPVGETIFDFLKEQFLNYSLHVLFIHSCNYYGSAVSLNEMGAAWVLRSNYTSILLPGFSYNKMVGVVNNQDIAIKLDNQNTFELKDKLNQLKETLSEELEFSASQGIIWERARDSFIDVIHQISDLEKADQPQTDLKMQQVSENRVSSSKEESDPVSVLTTDDERIVLYYVLTTGTRKVSKKSICEWLNKNEIYGVNIDNGFDLLTSFGEGAIVEDTLNLDVALFRKYSSHSDDIISILKGYVEKHIKKAADTFTELWDKQSFDKNLLLFLSYIIDERMTTFGDRWMAEGQVANIKQWENSNCLEPVLSNNYGSCLEFFKQNDLVYESSWTSCGNPREYTLCTSLRNLLFNGNTTYAVEADAAKSEYIYEFPF